MDLKEFLVPLGSVIAESDVQQAFDLFRVSDEFFVKDYKIVWNTGLAREFASTLPRVASRPSNLYLSRKCRVQENIHETNTHDVTPNPETAR